MPQKGDCKPENRQIKINSLRESTDHVGNMVQIDSTYHGWLEERTPKA